MSLNENSGAIQEAVKGTDASQHETVFDRPLDCLDMAPPIACSAPGQDPGPSVIQNPWSWASGLGADAESH